jgi:hypothetical protein
MRPEPRAGVSLEKEGVDLARARAACFAAKESTPGFSTWASSAAGSILRT